MIASASQAILWCLYKVWLGNRSSNWPSVVGKISEVNIAHRPGSEGGGAEYQPRVRYLYAVHGTQYENNSGIHRVLNDWGTKQQAEHEVARYAGREDVRVFYNPRRPSMSVLEPGVSLSLLWLIPFASLLIVIGLHLVRIVRIEELFGG